MRILCSKIRPPNLITLTPFNLLNSRLSFLRKKKIAATGLRIKSVITSYQLRAARALLDLDQRELADLTGLSLPTIQRMEGSDNMIRGNVGSLTKLVTSLNKAGIELIGENAPSMGLGRGVRLVNNQKEQ